MRSSNNPINDESHISSLKKSLPYPLYVLLLIILIHFYYNPFYSFSPTNNIIIPSSQDQVPRKNRVHETSCDYSNGEWVPSKSEPLYNDTTCSDTITPGQNCVLFGRPDRNYLYWKWSPRNCKLPRFDPATFLKLLENKHVAFVGDSLARNQLESLICMLSTASRPHLYDTGGEYNKFRKWRFPSHNITVSNYWSPFLVKGDERRPDKNFNTLFVDSVNEVWASDVEHMDMLVLLSGQWYLHPAVYYAENTVLGCHYCVNHTEIGFFHVYGRALKTAFESIIRRKEQTGKGMAVFFTTFSPAHFVGEWDKLGACRETRPYRESEKVLEGMDEEMRRIAVEKVREANVMAAKEKVGVRLEALDITKLALMRPDGHPGPYMSPYPFLHGDSERVPNDCVHWCLPGPIDAWNEILLDVINRYHDHLSFLD